MTDDVILRTEIKRFNGDAIKKSTSAHDVTLAKFRATHEYN